MYNKINEIVREGESVSTILKLVDVRRNRGQLAFTVAIHGENYTCSYVYQDVCFDELDEQYGKTHIDWLCFHIVAFEMAKFCSLAPEKIDFGLYAHFCTPTFFSFWQHIVFHIWGQWRYENNLPDYHGPVLSHALADTDVPAIDQRNVELDYLVFCGGGKDSLVMMRTLDRQGIEYGSFIYTHSVYGEHQHQLDLITNLVDRTHAKNVHFKQIDDAFIDESELIAAKRGVKCIIHAETPCSIFGALPLMLNKGYRCAVLAHERSADVGNLVWDETGEEINHQWGKSWEAEHAINTYINQHLIHEFSYFSLLKPLTDVAIFNLLKKDVDLIDYMHSCNIEKPWCKKCAKCAYVWLNLKAYLPSQRVDAIFGGDLFDIPENEKWFRQMLGLEDHTPFECIGQIEEARLALEIYLQTNEHSLATQLRSEFDEDFSMIVDTMTMPMFDDANLDPGLQQGIEAYFRSEAGTIREHLLSRLSDRVDNVPSLA